MPNSNPLNDLGVALSHYWANERVLEQAKIQRDRAWTNLQQAFEAAGNTPTAVILEKKLYIVQSDGAGGITTEEMPWVLTDLSVPARN